MNNQDLKAEGELIAFIIKEVAGRLQIEPAKVVERARLQVKVQNARSVVFKVLTEYIHYSRVASAFALSPESVRQCNWRCASLFEKRPRCFEVYDEVLSLYEDELIELRELENA